MENAVDALHIGFAILVFVIAVSLAFTVFSQAREVADVVLYYNDRTNFEEYVPQLANQNRIVGIETIIPAIRRYATDNEGYSVEIIVNGKQEYVFDLLEDQKNNLTPTQIYRNLDKNLEELMKKYTNTKFTETYSEYIVSRR